MKEIKLVNGQILRKDLKEMEKMEVEYDTLQAKLDSLNDVIYSHHDKTREEISVLMRETNQIEQVMAELWKKLDILQLFKDVEGGEEEENEDIEIEKNNDFTTLEIVMTLKKFVHKKGFDTLGGRGTYKKLEVIEKFAIETSKLPENFEYMKQHEQVNFIVENGIFQQ